MAKDIYIGRPGGHVNEHRDNLVINEQLLICDKKNLCKYKKIYPTSKVWILLESEFNSPIPQQLMPYIKPEINLIDYQKEQIITYRLAQIGSILLIHQETITLRRAHIGLIFPICQIIPNLANALSSTPPI